MTRYLTIHVRTHEGRYHGHGDDPASPFRVFQALVAGAGIGGPLDEQTKIALRWLEELPDAPLIASPRTVRGESVSMFMPNNDLDAKGGDVRRVGEIRLATKVWRPRLFDASIPFIFAWRFDGDDTNARVICDLADKLYQFGRGVDMAWAYAEILDETDLDSLLIEYDGVVSRPGRTHGRVRCPASGSLKSLDRRYRARRFRYESGQSVFVKPLEPNYRQLEYESPTARHVFELRSTTNVERSVAWPLARASSLVVSAREAARACLSAAMSSRANEIDRHLVGRKPDGSSTAPAQSRVRIIPIPSIGMHYADRAIRRLLIEVPAACPLRSEDVRWAFSGAELFDSETGEAKDVLLSPSADEDMLRHYGIGMAARVFRSVTPVALPEHAKRRRIEPTRQTAEAKEGLDRVVEIQGARAAIVQALRHAGVRARVEAIRAQREPFDAAGSRVEPFAEGTRFEKERLWHVEITFDAPVGGPLLIGDGRFLGLGLMAPVPAVVQGVHAFAVVDGLQAEAQPIDIARALRRAVMARVQSTIDGHEPLPPFFSGHEPGGAPIRRFDSSHLAFAFDPVLRLLLVLAPHMIERRWPAEDEPRHLRSLDRALDGFRELRAGNAGLLTLVPRSVSPGPEDPLFGPSRVWESLTPYVVTRHIKGVGAAEALGADVRAECRRIGLSEPKVEPLNVRGVPAGGLTGDLRLSFGQDVAGPILLGRTRYLGGGLFRAVRRAPGSHPLC
jgi:CRISPR-associated protein Csb2